MTHDLNTEFKIHSTPTTSILHVAARCYLKEALMIRNLNAATLETIEASRVSEVSADSFLSTTYICSHLVADILLKLGALYPSAVSKTKYFVPADLSSSSVVPGISLWFRTAENERQDLYSISPDVEFQKKGSVD